MLTEPKVIAGESLGTKAVIDTITPIMYLHFTLKPGSRIIQPVPKDYNTFAYVIKGKGVYLEKVKLPIKLLKEEIW